MEISLKRNHGFYLVVKADNVNIEEDIEKRVYSKDENGKTILPPNAHNDNPILSYFISDLREMLEAKSKSICPSLFQKIWISQYYKRFSLNSD